MAEEKRTTNKKSSSNAKSNKKNNTKNNNTKNSNTNNNRSKKNNSTRTTSTRTTNAKSATTKNSNTKKNTNTKSKTNVKSSKEKTNATVVKSDVNKGKTKKVVTQPEVVEEKITIQQAIAEEKQKNRNRIKKFIIFILLIVLVGLLCYFGYEMFYDTFKSDVYIELGTNTITIDQFFEKKTMKNSSIKTKLDTINFDELGDYEIEIKIGKKVRTATLHIIDTTSPVVEFKNVQEAPDYEFKPEDFIVSMKDLTEMTVEVESMPDLSIYGEQKVVIIVKDSSGNETRSERTLYIGAMVAEYHLELGTKLKKTDLLYKEENANAINDEDIDEINKSGVGEYIVSAVIGGETFSSKVIVRDTQGPVITVKNVSIYNDVNGGLSMNAFVKSITDASKYTATLKSEIVYGKIGKYDMVIEAVDEYGNKSTATATLSIVKDTVGPVFSGLSDITIAKNTNYDYQKGVKAVDAKDGVVSFTVDTSAVKIGTTGTYYATYTAKDKSGNTTTKKRKVTVNPDHSDVQAKVKAVAATLGNSIEEVNKYVHNHIKYVGNIWGGKTYDGAVWQGLTQGRGNCYVYAQTLYALLQAKGYQVQLAHTNNYDHYWVFVYDPKDGKWWHSEAQNNPPYPKLTDAQMAKLIPGRPWDKTKWSTENQNK